jgi:hypothetical protein
VKKFLVLGYIQHIQREIAAGKMNPEEVDLALSKVYLWIDGEVPNDRYQQHPE